MLPDGFTLNQTNLQDFVDCPRRFQLRYVQGRRWPAVMAEPLSEHEAFVRRGVRFHRLVERHQLGLPAERLVSGLEDPILRSWWEAYLSFEALHALSGQRLPEFRLSGKLCGVRAMAALDLVVVEPDSHLTIFDWKTYGYLPSRVWLASRMQTVLYPYLVAAVGPALWGGWLQSDLISMIYWVPVASDSPVTFQYSAEQHWENSARLAGLVQAILAGEVDAVWPLTDEPRRCDHCQFRSHCDRGTVAGTFAGVDDWEEVPLEVLGALLFDDVVEVGF